MTDLQAELESLRTENARLRRLLKLTDGEAAPSARLREARHGPTNRFHARGCAATPSTYCERSASVAAKSRLQNLQIVDSKLCKQ